MQQIGSKIVVVHELWRHEGTFTKYRNTKNLRLSNKLLNRKGNKNNCITLPPWFEGARIKVLNVRTTSAFSWLLIGG